MSALPEGRRSVTLDHDERHNMPLTLRIKDPHTGEETPLHIRDYEELTLADWKAFNPLDEPRGDIDDIYNSSIRKICLYTGLPESTVEKWDMKTFNNILTHVRRELERAYLGSDKFKKSLADGTDFIPEPLVIIGGKPYDVPLDMDRVLIAQFAEWEKWDPPAHEADLVAESLAFMLVEAGGEYQGATKEKIAEMMQCTKEVGMDLCAFFFSKSEGFATVTSQRSRKFRDWTKRQLTDTLRILPSDIEALTSSTGQQN